MSTIFVEPLFHNNKWQIAMRFPYDFQKKEYVRKLRDVKWSQSHRVFYLNNTPDNKIKVFNHLKVSEWSVDYKAFQNWTPPKPKKEKEKLSNERQLFFHGFVKFLVGKRYSKSTIGVYSGFVKDFLFFLGTKPLDQLSNRDVSLFIEEVIIKRSYSISTHRQLVSAIKQLATYYPEAGINAPELTRPKKSRKLPSVLSQEEVIDLLRSTKNLKHRAILGLIYSCGLRIGELIQLKLQDILIDRRQVFIRNAKGRKDRYVVLAESFLPLMQNYLATYRPITFFVEGRQGKPYSESSIRKFLFRSCKAAKIIKHVTPHTLRHSYATHLIENGIGLRHIQELLGHSRPETTMLYTHIAKKDLLEINSPLDIILKKITKTEKREQNALLSRNL